MVTQLGIANIIGRERYKKGDGSASFVLLLFDSLVSKGRSRR